MDELPSPATPIRESTISRRLITISALSIAIGLAGGVVAKALLSLIGLISNLVFFGRVSTELVPLSTDHVGLFVIVIPVLGALVIGALVIGAMARYGSPAIRGHGIPEVMERVLYGGSRIPAKLMVLKPLSAAIAIGTGGRCAKRPITWCERRLGGCLLSKLAASSSSGSSRGVIFSPRTSHGSKPGRSGGARGSPALGDSVAAKRLNVRIRTVAARS